MKKKANEISAEYLTNDLTEFKRAALINMDMDLVKDLGKYMENSKGYHVYYARVSETVIRNREGIEVDISSLRIPIDEISFHFWNVGFPWLLTSESNKDKPGDLYRLVTSPYTPHERKTIIKEVPDETTFPLPVLFDWDKICLDYMIRLIYEDKDEQTQHLIYEPRRCRRFYGVSKRKTYHWISKNGTKMINITKPEEGIEYTITESW